MPVELLIAAAEAEAAAAAAAAAITGYCRSYAN